ncbi:hypothetical protein GJAV_G00248600 [Gymnothorax javanicus]|nr:hypothetical protein GJAV_G00248600 [Gymnothorax javanicus]
MTSQRLSWVTPVQPHPPLTPQRVTTCNLSHLSNSCFSSGRGGVDEFLPIIKPPSGLVGQEAARQPAPRQQATFSNVSFKHPLTEIQNSVRNLRVSRPSQEQGRSVFHYDLPQEPPPTDLGSPTSATPTLLNPAQKDPAQGTQNSPVTPHSATTPQPPDPPKAPDQPDLPVSCSLLPAPQGGDPELGRRPPSPDLSTNRSRMRSSTSLPPHWSQDETSHLKQEVQTLSEELRIQKELAVLLHNALEEAQREKRGRTQLRREEEEGEEREEDEAVEALDRQVAELTAQLQFQRCQREALEHALSQRDEQVAELEGHVELLVEKNRAKQQVVLQLSEQVEACLADPLRPISNSMGTRTLQQFQEELHQLQDDIAAYKTQTQFLNSEIYQLTWLWRRSSEQEKNLMMKCMYLETRSYQRERRYLDVLRSLQESAQLDCSQQEAVDRLIEETLLGDIKNQLKLDPVREYDEYGFRTVPDFDVEDVKLLAKIQALDVRSHNLIRREFSGGGGGDAGVSARWAQYLSSSPGGEMAHSTELKNLLRCGVPPEYRRQVWLWLVGTRTRSLQDNHPERYKEMLEKSRSSPHPASRQIQLDLHRTLNGNQRFSSPSDPAIQQLHRVLLAFTWQNPTIGYCQGLNRIAALALLVLQNEEDAFWCLVAVVETIMPQDYYSKTLAASQADQRVLRDLMLEKLPRLIAHLDELQVDLTLITFNWFLVVFIESLPTHILLRIWDAFLCEGIKVLFRYALALLKYREEDLLKIQDKVEMYQYLRFFTKTVTDGRRLMNIAFNAMNPLPMKLLTDRRTVHLEQLRAELCELEREQSEYTSQHPKRADKDPYANASEDEEEEG